jgi:ATP-dependent phosphoenolpyruvate carboxykinase
MLILSRRKILKEGRIRKLKIKGKKSQVEVIEEKLETESIVSQIKPISEIVSPESYLFYGRSGTGKTTLACSAPKPLLLIDINDKGTDSVIDVEGVYGVQCKTWEHLEEIYWFLQKGTKYKTAVLDTVTQMQNFGIAKVKVAMK